MGTVLQALIRFVLAASLVVSGGTKTLPQSFAEAIAKNAFYSPLVETPDGPKVTAAFLVALSWTEGGFNPAAIGDGGYGHCALGIYLPPAAPRTFDGWTGAELDADPDKCVRAGLRLLRWSVEHGPTSCPMCIYARGPNWRNKCVHTVDGVRSEGPCAAGEKPIAITLSDYRFALAKRALSIPLENTP